MRQYGYGYGSNWFTSWLDSPAGTSVEGDADEGVIGGTCVDHTGLLGNPGAKVSCAALRAALEGKPPGTYRQYETILDGDDPEPPPPPKPEIPKWLYAALVGVIVVGGYTVYKRTQ